MDFDRHLSEYLSLGEALRDRSFAEGLGRASAAVTDSFRKGGKLLLAGNGGSAADAQHLAAEFVCTFLKKRRGLPAIALASDSSVLTAWGNDYEFADVFARQIEALGKPEDVLLVFSTSGNSENILRALIAAKKGGLETIAFLGRDGGKARGLAGTEIVVPSESVPRIQEVHTFFFHVLAEEVEKKFA